MDYLSFMLTEPLQFSFSTIDVAPDENETEADTLCTLGLPLVCTCIQEGRNWPSCFLYLKALPPLIPLLSVYYFVSSKVTDLHSIPFQLDGRGAVEPRRSQPHQRPLGAKCLHLQPQNLQGKHLLNVLEAGTSGNKTDMSPC